MKQQTQVWSNRVCEKIRSKSPKCDELQELGSYGIPICSCDTAKNDVVNDVPEEAINMDFPPEDKKVDSILLEILTRIRQTKGAVMLNIPAESIY